MDSELRFRLYKYAEEELSPSEGAFWGGVVGLGASLKPTFGSKIKGVMPGQTTPGMGAMLKQNLTTGKGFKRMANKTVGGAALGTGLVMAANAMKQKSNEMHKYQGEAAGGLSKYAEQYEELRPYILQQLHRKLTLPYVQPMTCQVCGYEGEADPLGCCPSCGAEGGVKKGDEGRPDAYVTQEEQRNGSLAVAELAEIESKSGY